MLGDAVILGLFMGKTPVLMCAGQTPLLCTNLRNTQNVGRQAESFAMNMHSIRREYFSIL